MGRCNVCAVTTRLRCSACSISFYCGRDHQLQDWKHHKKTCETCELVEGVSLFELKAKVDLKKSAVLLEASPLLKFPVLPLKKEREAYPDRISAQLPPNRPPFDFTSRLIPCLGCYELTAYGVGYVDMERGPVYGRCSQCRWPIHTCYSSVDTKSCEASMDHLPECEYFIAHGLQLKSFNDLPKDISWIGILRAVLYKLEKKHEYKLLMKMPVNPRKVVDGTKSGYELRMIKAALKEVKEIKKFIYGFCGFKKRFIREAELEHLINVVHSNFLPCSQPYGFHKAFAGVVYEAGKGRVMTHSCIPNCRLEMDMDTLKGKFIVHRPIKKGEVLTINYAASPHEIRGLSLNSRSIYLQTYLSCPPCTCPRCSDPTENGTYFSAVRCTSKEGCTGHLVPVNPTSLSLDSPWTCTNADCTQRATHKEIEAIILHFCDEVRNYGEEASIGERLSLIKEHEKTLHPNHFKILSHLLELYKDIEAMIIRPATQCVGSFNHADFQTFAQGFVNHRIQDYLEILKRSLDFYDLIQPGLNCSRAKIQVIYNILRLSKMMEEFQRSLSKTVAEKEAFLQKNLSPFVEMAGDLTRAIICLWKNPVEVKDHEIIWSFTCLELAHFLNFQIIMRKMMQSHPAFPWTTCGYRAILDQDWFGTVHDILHTHKPTPILLSPQPEEPAIPVDGFL